MKIVINTCFGGFGLSKKAIKELAKRKNVKLTNRDSEYFLIKKTRRNDSDLVAIVEEMGDNANTRYSDIAIIEIPDDVNWIITQHDGMEHVAEQHRTWGVFQ